MGPYCSRFKDQTKLKKISPDEFLAALSLMFRLLKRHIKASSLKGDYYRTLFTEATLRENESFAEAMLAILHPKESEDLSKSGLRRNYKQERLPTK